MQGKEEEVQGVSVYFYLAFVFTICLFSLNDVKDLHHDAIFKVELEYFSFKCNSKAILQTHFYFIAKNEETDKLDIFIDDFIDNY